MPRTRARPSTTATSGRSSCWRRYAAAWPTSPPAASASSCRSPSSSSRRTSSPTRRRRRSAMGREDLAREALTRKSGLAGQVGDLRGAAGPAPGRGGEAHARLPAAAGQGRGLPHQEGDHQGHLHRRGGADPDQRGVLRHLRGDGRRRHGRPARRGQDRADAGPRRRDRRADRLRRARRRQLASARATTSPASSTRCPRSPTSRPSWPRCKAEVRAPQSIEARRHPRRPPSSPPSRSRPEGGGTGMIVRILGEGQWDVADDQLDRAERPRRRGRVRGGGGGAGPVRRRAGRAAGRRTHGTARRCPTRASWTPT